MKFLKQQPFGLMVCLFGLAAAGEASGRTVSVSFSSESLPQVMDKADAAGAPGARADHWNSVCSSTELTQNRLLFDDGTESAVSITRSSGRWLSNRDLGPLSGDDRMFCGVLDVQAPISITFAGVPFGEYDVYVYRRSDQCSRAGSFTIGSRTYYMRDTSASHPGQESEYILSSDTAYSGNRSALTEEIDAGNYVRFAGMTGSEFTLTLKALSAADDAYPRSKVAGIQIVDVSKPLGLVLN